MGVSPLADLIEEARDAFVRRTGVPLGFADLARRSGDVLTRGEFSDLANKVPKQMPKVAKKIEAIARALEVTEGQVTEAYARTVGYMTLDMERRGLPRWKPGRSLKAVDAITVAGVSEGVASMPAAAKKGTPRRESWTPGEEPRSDEDD